MFFSQLLGFSLDHHFFKIFLVPYFGLVACDDGN